MRLCHCPNCKQEIEPEAAVCLHCGEDVNRRRAGDIAHVLLFAMAIVSVFTLIAAFNDRTPGREESARAAFVVPQAAQTRASPAEGAAPR